MTTIGFGDIVPGNNPGKLLNTNIISRFIISVGMAANNTIITDAGSYM
jgi:hypothetical protein